MENYTFDLHRIFFGDLPPLFLVEILFRIAILYVYTLANLRVLGKRSASELTPLDLLIVVGLGSAIGDPMFYPKVGLLHGMVTSSTGVLIQRAVVYFANRNEQLEDVIKGVPIRVVVDGMIDTEGMKKAQLSREEIFMLVRQAGHTQIGELRRVYIETDGKVSLYPYDKSELPRAGLNVLPPWDVDAPVMHCAEERVALTDRYACTVCGYTDTFEEDDTFPACPRCESKEWSHASYEQASSGSGS